MKSRANNTKTDRRAQRKARESIARTNFSGVWDPVPEKTDDDEIEEVSLISPVLFLGYEHVTYTSTHTQTCSS